MSESTRAPRKINRSITPLRALLLALGIMAALLAARGVIKGPQRATLPGESAAAVWISAPWERRPDHTTALIEGQSVQWGELTRFELIADASGQASLSVSLIGSEAFDDQGNAIPSEAAGKKRKEPSAMRVDWVSSGAAFRWDGRRAIFEGLKPHGRYAMKATLWYRGRMNINNVPVPFGVMMESNPRTNSVDCAPGCAIVTSPLELVGWSASAGTIERMSMPLLSASPAMIAGSAMALWTLLLFGARARRKAIRKIAAIAGLEDRAALIVAKP